MKQAFDRASIDMPEPPSPTQTVAQAVTPDRHLEAEVAEERRREGDDLLDPAAPTE